MDGYGIVKGFTIRNGCMRHELVYTPDGGSQTVVSEASAETFSHTLDGACTVQTRNGYVGSILPVR